MKASDLRPIQARSGATLQASALGLGAAALGGLYEPVTDAAAQDVLETAWGLGLRFVDTAPYYGYTRSERRVGSFLAGKPRAQFILSTKAGRLMRPDASVAPGDDGWADPLPFRPHYDYGGEGILRSFEDSLQRLGLARIDVLLVHDIGQLTHGDAHARHWQALCDGGGWRALEGLRRRGLVGAIGLGVNEAEVARAALDAADIDCVLLAGRYTLLEQGALPLLDECARRQVSVLVGGPYNSGLLAGQARYDYAAAPPQALARAEALRAACARHGVPLQAAALQFPLAHPAVAAVLSGMRTADEVRANVAWFETPIPAALWADLRGAGLVAAGAPVPEPGAGAGAGAGNPSP